MCVCEYVYLRNEETDSQETRGQGKTENLDQLSYY